MPILCATDFSAASAGTTRLAEALARLLGDSVVVVHVLERPTDVYAELPGDARVWEQAMRESAERNLATAVDSLRNAGITVDGRLETGAAHLAINELAGQIGARLIVIGSHGRGALGRILLGSVAERTIQQARRPVLVVRGSTDGLEAWCRRERELRVLVGIEGSAASVAALGWLSSLRAAGPCQLTLLHAFWPPQEYARLGMQRIADSQDADAEVLRLVERDLRARLGLAAEGAQLSIVPHWGRVGELVARTATELPADLVVVGTHQRHGVERLRLGSVAADTLHGAQVPVLCVPPAASVDADRPSLPRLRRVLAATDFSPSGNAAVLHAYALLCGTEGGTVELMHVVPPDPAGLTFTPAARQLAEERLRALIPVGAETSGIATHVTVTEAARPADMIMLTAERSGADAIAVGAHGATGVLDRLLVGSVTDALLRRAQKQVYVVRLPPAG